MAWRIPCSGEPTRCADAGIAPRARSGGDRLAGRTPTAAGAGPPVRSCRFHPRPGRRIGARRAPGPPGPRPRLHHRRPPRTRRCRWSRGWADAVWDVGREFGTIGAAQRSGIRLEITTYRGESYDPESRKPEVEFGDIARRRPGAPRLHRQRDGRARCPDAQFVDPLRRPGRPRGQGAAHARARPEDSFGDDPLRMMRAARFAVAARLRASTPRWSRR